MITKEQMLDLMVEAYDHFDSRSDIIDAIRALIESSGGEKHPLVKLVENMVDMTPEQHRAANDCLRELIHGEPAPSPGPSAKEVEEAMFRMEMFANCHGSKDEVADAAVIRAALSKQGPQAGYCEMCKGTGEVDGPLEGQRLPCPGPKHRPAPTIGEREEMLAFVDRLIWSFEKQGLKEVIVGVGYYPALNKLRALILAPPIRVTREEMRRVYRLFDLEATIKWLREKGVEVSEAPEGEKPFTSPGNGPAPGPEPTRRQRRPSP